MIGRRRHGVVEPSNVARRTATVLWGDPIGDAGQQAVGYASGLSLAGRTGLVAWGASAYARRLNGYLTAGGLTPISQVGMGARTLMRSQREERSLPNTVGPIVSQNQAMRAYQRNGGGR